MEERDLRRLLQTKNGCRVPKMPPIPDVHEMDKLPFIPQPPYNRLKEKRETFCDLFREKPVLKKKETFPPLIETNDRDDLEIPQAGHIAILRDCAHKIRPPPMSKVWERKIYSLVSSKHRQVFPRQMEELLNESKFEWERDLHNLAVKTIIRDEPGVSRVRYKEPYFKYKGITENYEKIMKYRKKLQEDSLFLHPFIILILESAQRTFPYSIIKFTKYREKSPLTLNELEAAILFDIKCADYLVSSTWYGILINWMKMPKCLKGMRPKKIAAFTKCASKMIALQIQELMRRSISVMIDSIKDPESIPVLNIDLDFDGVELNYVPSINCIFEAYHNFVDEISRIGQRLMPVEQYLKLPYEHDAIPVNFNMWLYKDSHSRLQIELNVVLGPLLIYLDKLRNRYNMLCGPTTKQELLDYIKENKSFVKAVEKIKYFQGVDSDIKSLLDKEYFYGATVCQLNIINGLKQRNLEFVNYIMTSIIKSHMDENESICNHFEEIATKALREPENALELMEQGVYILHAKTVLVETLKERVMKQISIMSHLLEMTTLTNEHIALNRRTINWLTDINRIFEKNTIACEAQKVAMEKYLSAEIGRLTNMIQELVSYLVLLDYMDDVNHTLEYLEYLRKIVQRLDDCDKIVLWINNEEITFNFPITTYPDLEELKEYIIPFYNLVYLVHKWKRSYSTWMDGPFEYLDNFQIETDHDFYYKEFLNISRNYKRKILQQITKGVKKRFQGSVDDVDINNLPAPLKLCVQVVAEIKEWTPNIHMAHIMCNQALVQRHWDEMSAFAGFDLTPTAGTTLRKFINLDLWDNLHEYEIISNSSTKELELLSKFHAMQSEWTDICFKTRQCKDSGTYILSKLDDIQYVLDDHIIKTIGMIGSAFVKPFEAQVNAWYDKIIRANVTINEWAKVQSEWLLLLSIFESKDIVAQIPEEAVIFQEVDNTYRKYMNSLETDSHVLKLAGSVGVLEGLKTVSALVEKIYDGMNYNFDKKRLYFPRMFFLTNNEMLEILSHTKNPPKIQPYLKKLFEGISRLEFDANFNIIAMISMEIERVEFLEEISVQAARCSVEKWLVQVEQQMLMVIKSKSKLSYYEYQNTSRVEWVLSWEGMIVLAISQIYWAINAHDVLNTHKLSELYAFYESLTKQLNKTVGIIQRKDLTKLNSVTVRALIVIDVHAKDVIIYLAKNNVTQVTDFQWLAQLRYYWEEGNVIVKLINAAVNYAYEYLGNSDRLVITPLTDRCYRTLIGAYYLHLNGALEGPVGTGKTETVKDLAKAFAIQCVIFNCSDGVDYQVMGNFLKGMSSCGAWVCFEEFNRINIEVLSVIAQQISCIIQAVRLNADTFEFEGTVLNFKPACYIIITMDTSYSSRSELPVNLKFLFRTVAMTVPDYIIIGEISLYSFGFLEARKMSVKIITIHRLCADQLSLQNHYDFGIRAVKTVLSAVGNLKSSFPNENESLLLVRSIMDVHLSKLLYCDIPLFEAIISDLFPGITLPIKSFKPDFVSLANACSDCCANNNLQLIDGFLSKIIQTYEMMLVRHGIMLVGDPFSGKSMTIKILSETLTLMHNRNLPGSWECTYEVLNPKAVTINQLYGAFDPISYEWTDGIIANIFRSFALDDTLVRKWLVFDGPVDALWIEGINTVLDDSKKLCLKSGEIIHMTSVMSIIFEVMDLCQASPAIVSRCGMIYMKSSTLGYRPFYKSWLNTLNPIWYKENEDYIYEMCEWLFAPLLYYVKQNGTNLVNSGEVNLLISTLRLIEMQMDKATEGKKDTRYTRTWFLAALMNALVWGIGGVLGLDSRKKFDNVVKEYFTGDKEIPDSIELIDVSIPVEGMIVEHYYIFKGKGCWKPWSETVDACSLQEQSINLFQTVIPCEDSLKYFALLDLHTQFKKPLLLIGPTATGKSFYVQHFLMNKINMDKYTPGFVTFTTTTTASQTHELIISKLYKRQKNSYGPSKGKTAVIFIDDMNMPTKQIYGAQPVIELIRLYFDQHFWYDLKTTNKLYIDDTFFYGAIGLVGGSRQLIYPRMLRHFNIYSINELCKDSMIKIYTSLLELGWNKNGFNEDLTTYIINIMEATMSIYDQVTKGLRPTLEKPHYIFNIRDFSRVIQGCTLLRKESAHNKKIFTKIWVHEILRVFCDRLVNEKDRSWFLQVLKITTENCMKETFETVFSSYRNSCGEVTQDTIKNFMFGSYLDTESLDDARRYEEIPSKKAVLRLANTMLAEYNAKHKVKMTIVLFDYVIEHLSKICRLLCMPSGNALLVGVAGSGRQSLTRLAGTMLGQQVYQPQITKTYCVKNWHDDLKLVLRQSGGLNKDTIFLFSERQIQDEIFIQNLDSLLNSGEVPNLYGLNESQDIIKLVRLAAQGGNRNLDISPLQTIAFFMTRCKAKLHIVLCFSPIGSSFRTILILYPSMINYCTIIWYDSWPEDALEKVAHYHIDDVDVPDKIKAAVVSGCKQFHFSAQKVSIAFFYQYRLKTYITPTTYLHFIKSFTTLFKRKEIELRAARLRYTKGIDKTTQAAEAITTMQLNLDDLKSRLIIMTEKSAKMTEVIMSETASADKVTAQVIEDQKLANVQAASAQELKKDCEADLALALPILEDSIEALNTLKPSDITIVKSMKNPPSTIKLVMAAVCVMKGIPPDKIPDPDNPGKKIKEYWGPSKRILGDMDFLDSLKNFDKDNIPAKTIETLRNEYLSVKEFKPHIVAKASAAAEGLCKWIIAMNMYDALVKIVVPKKEKLEAVERELAETIAFLKEKKATVARLEANLAQLKLALNEVNMKKKILEDEVQLCVDKIYRAEKLIGGLDGERVRWTAAADNLHNLIGNLVGDILLSCGLIVYLAPYDSSTRSNIIEKWTELTISLNIPHSPTFAIKDILGTDIKVEKWCMAGLPKDSFSVDNGVMLDNSSRWSILIDPHGHGNKWIKAKENGNDLRISKLTDGDYIKVIERSIEYGQPVLIENLLEEVEAPLDPFLQKLTFIEGGKVFIALGDNVLELHPNFRLYMTTNLKSPHFIPEVSNNVTLINFALEKESLEDKLLGIVVAKERPDLQETREKLNHQSVENLTALQQMEDDILRTVQETKGILEDDSIAEVLDLSKLLVRDIMKKQEATIDIEMSIESFRLGYIPIASHATILYYCVKELSNIDPMYQYSLSWFMNLYIISIETANKSRDLEKRLSFLKDCFTYNLYCNVCRSLFNKDTLIFSFMMCAKLMLSVGDIYKDEYFFLITGGHFLDNPLKKPFEWISGKSWDEICRMSDLRVFRGFKDDFVKNISKWQQVYDDMEPHNKPLPGIWNEKLTNFQKLLVIRVLRPDRLTIAISEFVERRMGRRYITPPPFNLEESFSESNCLTPLIFILSPGTDPMGVLIKYCGRIGYLYRLNCISLGQGQEPIARAMIEKAQQEGGWVCLQNCHLAENWFPELEKIIENLDLTNTDLKFRLWLTIYPSDNFPKSILQAGIKMTIEPSKDLRHNLNRCYISEPLNRMEFFEGCPGKDNLFSKLLYAVSFFHVVVQERKKFGPLGWNIQYDFNDSDFDISVRQLQMFCNQYEDIQYVAIKYLTGECNYGGRVTDDWDRRLIVTLLDNYINPAVVNNPSYIFCDIGPPYGLPRRCAYKDYLKHIESLPVNPPPEAFGLHTNAGFARDNTMFMSLTSSLRAVEGIVPSIEGSASSDTEVILLGIVGEILLRLPSKFDVEIVQQKYPVDYDETMNIVLVQEMERYNRLLSEIQISLMDLEKGLRGLMIMSPALDHQAKTMLLGKIPQNWVIVSYQSLKPLSSYISDFIERLAMLQNWYEYGKPPTYWLSGFFFPQAFITGSLQNYARSKSIPFELLLFDFEVRNVDYEKLQPPWGVYVQGLFMDGGRWNRESRLIDEQYPKILNESMPAIWLCPRMESEFQEGSRYKCPLYKTLQRKAVQATTVHSPNFVLAFYLPSDKPSAHWIKRSVALMLQLDN